MGRFSSWTAAQWPQSLYFKPAYVLSLYESIIHCNQYCDSHACTACKSVDKGQFAQPEARGSLTAFGGGCACVESWEWWLFSRQRGCRRGLWAGPVQEDRHSRVTHAWLAGRIASVWDGLQVWRDGRMGGKTERMRVSKWGGWWRGQVWKVLVNQGKESVFYPRYNERGIESFFLNCDKNTRNTKSTMLRNQHHCLVPELLNQLEQKLYTH